MTQRTREEIEKSINKGLLEDRAVYINLLTLEVLLDIRELLINEPCKICGSKNCSSHNRN